MHSFPMDCSAGRPVQRVTTCTACSHPPLWVGSRRDLKFSLWGLLGELLVSASLPPVPPLCLCGGDWPGLATRWLVLLEMGFKC